MADPDVWERLKAASAQSRAMLAELNWERPQLRLILGDGEELQPTTARRKMRLAWDSARSVDGTAV